MPTEIFTARAMQPKEPGHPVCARPGGARGIIDRVHTTSGSTRLDRWLWAVRLAKTRPDAAAACRGGHVRVNGKPAKPAAPVRPGDEIRARVHDVTRIVEVVRVIQRRVGAADAVTCYLDRTPAPPPDTLLPVPRRDRGAGRPTKRERRVLDEFRRR